jgi:hypothetical protein
VLNITEKARRKNRVTEADRMLNTTTNGCAVREIRCNEKTKSEGLTVRGRDDEVKRGKK